MNTKQELMDAMNRENKGSAPPALFSQTGTFEQMAACGSKWPEANYEEDAMIDLALQPSKLLGFATVRIPFDLTSAAERLGCEIQKGTERIPPSVTGSPWVSESFDVPPEFMSTDEFLSGGRCATYIRAAERISKEHPDLFLTSSVIGPLELAMYFVGMENFVMNMFMNPEACEAWVARVTPYQCEYARALSEHSDNIFVITEAAEEIIPPDFIDAYLPYEKEVFSAIEDSFSTVHVCGETDNVLEKLVDLGATALSVLSNGDPKKLYDRLGDKVILAGGVDPVTGLMQGTPDDVRRSAKEAADAGFHVIMPECGVPPQTTNANLEALSRYRD